MKISKNLKQEFGQRLKTLRERQGLSQDKLAELCGWPSNTRVSGYERGANEPSLEDIARLATILEVYPEVLAFGIDTLAEHFTESFGGRPSNSTISEDVDLISRIENDLKKFKKQQQKAK